MRIYIFVLSVITLILISCDNDVNITIPDTNAPLQDDMNCLVGEGPIIMQSRTLLDSIQRIHSYVLADIHITQGPQEDLVIEGQENIINQIDSEIVNGILIFQMEGCVDITEAVQIYVTTPEIEALTQEGIGNFLVVNDFELTELRVTFNGLGDIELRGTVDSLEIDHKDGIGNVLAFDLVSKFCEITLAGVGDVEVFVDEELNVTLTGVGNVYYKGNPTITSNISGLGALIDAN